MCRSLHRWLPFFLLSLLIALQPAQAAAVRAYTGKVNEATSSIIQTKLKKYGFASNDPRFGATLSGVSTGLTAVAGGAAAVAVGAATWPAVLVGAAVSTVVAGAIYLGQDLLINWLWGDDGKIELSGQGMGSTDAASLPLLPGYVDILGTYGTGQNLYFRESNGNVRWVRTVGNICPAEGSCLTTSYAKNKDINFEDIASIPSEGAYWSNAYRRKVGNVVEVVYSFTRSPEPIKPPSYVPEPLTPEAAIAAVPEAAADAVLSPEMLASIANASWRAAQGQPNAVPWSATDPITAQDVKDWLKANPNLAPKVSDLLSPVAPPKAEAVPIPKPNEVVKPDPSPGTGTEVDLGEDPNTPAPELEDTPTANAILEPLLNLMPDLKNFSAPAHQSICPTPSFTVFDREHRFEAHCTLLEQNRNILEAAMLLVWSIAGLFIILRA